MERSACTWLYELGAFYLNFNGSDVGEVNGVYDHFSCNLNMTEATMTLIFPDSIKLEYDLTCAICLDTVFNPYALSCGHIFCKSCACSAAFVMIFQGLKAASPLLEYILTLKQSKEYWDLQSTYAVGLLLLVVHNLQGILHAVALAAPISQSYSIH
ncbi:putative E3 ubiquitin-protein ligase BAH1-like [Senna tora]|uniref:Putative E3 ubiquitin-protein ligase BAH1-like n=1 Tax=Senna tora TaxID=362788 RepID=A0A834SL56_9FABA|nr:putative E3 ubiquitin-protein ligase BAH1-like [Senna tora]